jgi:tetratricopeptide (TPR) repeat protein
VFEITGAGQARSRLQVAAARGLTPFVGRMAEMQQLVEALEQARAVRGRLIAVVGEAGVGKSRLLWELIHSAHSEGCTVLEGQAAPYAKEAPYAPIIDALRKHLGIDERKDPNEIRLQVANHLHARDRELATFVPAFLALLDVPVDAPDWAELDPLLRRARTIDGIRRLLLAESRRQPVVLVLEDLNWADSETNAVLASLVDMLPTTRILVIVSYRPEHGQRWSEPAPFESELRLAPLLPGIIETLLDTLLGSDPGLAQLKDVLREQTAGNPLFLEESIQALVETDVLTGSRGAYRLSRPFGSIQIAPSLLALLASRIDRIPPRDKQLLQSAAVIGKDVPVALLESIADLPADELRAALVRLQAGEFLHERSLFPDLEYTFKHALTHEVAYGGLLKDRRRALHGRIVDAIVALHRDRLREHVERLAHHAQRSERWPEAVDFCWQAGRKAMARSANREAVAYFDQALAALAHRPEDERTAAEAFEIRLDQRSALIPIGEFVRVFQILHELEALAERLGDVRKQGLVAALMSGAYPSLGRSDDAARYGERARVIATEIGDPVIDILASTYLAASYFFLGEYARSVACGERLVALLPRERGHDSFGVAIRPGVFGRGFLCWSLSELGRFAEAEAVACEALALADAVGHPQTVAAGLLTLGTFHVRRGDVARAIPPFERARELCQRHDIPLWRPVFASFLGYSLALSSRFDEAERLLRDAIEEASRMRLMVFHSQMIMWLGEACLLTGAVKEAATLAEEAQRNTAERKEAGLEAWALRLAAEVATRLEPLDAAAAETRYRDAMQRAERLGARPLVARCRLGLGVLYRRTGSMSQAREHLAVAAGAFRDMQMPLWSERAETALLELRSAP